MKRKIFFISIITLFIAKYAFCITRQEVINAAGNYIAVNWTCEIKNIKDEKMWDDVEEKFIDGTNDYDDRGETYYEVEENSVTVKKWKYDISLWPFVVNSTYTGEAYITDVLCPTS